MLLLVDPSLARVSITVGDVNDNPPRFGAVNESFIIGIPASFTTYYLVTEMVVSVSHVNIYRKCLKLNFVYGFFFHTHDGKLLLFV